MSKNDYDALAAWAETDDVFDAEPSIVEYGVEAAGSARRVLYGRPNVGSEVSGGGESPRRQVRLSRELDSRLDAYANEQGVSASEVIRRALDRYLNPA